MQLGYIGLGKMGTNMVERLLEKGHQVVAYNRTQEKVKQVEKFGAKGANSIKDLIEQLPSPRTIWLMLTAGKAVDQTLEELIKHLGTTKVEVRSFASLRSETVALM